MSGRVVLEADLADRGVLPLWTADSMDEGTRTTALRPPLGRVALAVIPCGYVWAQYVTKPGGPVAPRRVQRHLRTRRRVAVTAAR
jgi:hypothetical protein